MKLRRWISAGAVAVATAAALNAMPATASRPYDPTAQTLAALGQRHGLHIGTAVNATALNDASDPRYRQLVTSEFSSVTAENAMKWESLEPTRGTYDWAAADQLVEFAKRNRQSVRGHVLVWHNQLPAWLTSGVADGTISKQELRELLRKHITTVVNHYKGKIWQWDVVNEAVSDPWDTPSTLHYKGFWAENLGPGYIADAFRWARAADPKALLFYNDYNLEAFGSGNPADDKTQFVYDMAKGLRAQGVPIDGIGSQGHLGTQYGNFDTLQVTAALKRFAALGLATAFTEVDVRSEMTEAVRAGNSAEINPRSAGVGRQLQRADEGMPRGPHLPVVHRLGFQRQVLVGAGVVQRPAGGSGHHLRRELPAQAGVPGAEVRPDRRRSAVRPAAHRAQAAPLNGHGSCGVHPPRTARVSAARPQSVGRSGRMNVLS